MSKRVIISGGGTGGHVFPAIAIANALKTIDSDVKIHFVGAIGRLEMVKVPEAGYEISGLPVAGFERRLSLKNIAVVVMLIKSLLKARKIISSFKPDIAVGVGGYASGPILKMAGRKGIPTLIQEQNSYAGLTNKLLARKAKVICVAYEGMEKYFPAGKILLTGNPVRKDIVSLEGKRTGALKYFKLLEEIPVVLVLGGSGGSRTLNESIAAGLEKLLGERIQVIWQTGSLYYDDIIKSHDELEGSMIHVHAFIDRMDLAFAAADIVVSRAGAGTISELTMVGKPLILIPSAHVAGDHQAKNAMALVQRKAALMLNDRDAVNMLAGTIIELTNDKEKCRELSENISSMAIKDSDILIAKEIIKLIND